MQHGCSKLRLQDRGILRRPLHHTVQLLRDDVAPLSAFIPRANIQSNREVVLRLQERVRELLTRSMNNPSAFQKVDVGLDSVVASLLFAVRRITVKSSVDACSIARTRLFSLKHCADYIPNFTWFFETHIDLRLLFVPAKSSIYQAFHDRLGNSMAPRP